MSEHVAHQQQLQRTIERALENFKKIGKNNLTPAKVRSRISTLKEYWSQFSNGHAEVSRKIPEAIRSSFSYFKDNHYDATQAAYKNALDHMAEILEEMEPVVSPNPSLSSTRLHADASAVSLSHLPPIKLPLFDDNFDECVIAQTARRIPEPELSENVVTEREFPFNNLDESLLPRNMTDPTDNTPRETRRTRPYISRTPSRVSLRREFSLTSYESDLFDPEEIYSQQENNMAESRNPQERTPANPPKSAVDEEIENMRQSIRQMDQNIAEADRTPPPEINREERGDYTQIIHILNEIRADIHSLNIRVTRLESADAQLPRHTDTSRENDNDAFETTYGRTRRDIRNRRSVAPNYLPLKEARIMIPEFDGTSRHKLQKFLNACKYAVQNINPADEESLIQAILFTKLKGKAMQDFETRDIQTFDELKQQLETCYQSKQSTTHLQIEFNSLKQKPNETAHTFGQRVDLLAMKLYDSMIEGKEHSALSKRTIQQTIQAQALINYQIGLHDELQVLVRAQRYTTLQEAITGASAEEKLRPGTARTSSFVNKNKTESSYPRNSRNPTPQCFKCGKNGHYGRDCRSITGHKVHTIGKMYATIKIENHKVKHAFYVVRDDIPIEYEGIIGIDFLQQHSVSCDYNQNQLKIGEAVLRFHTFNKTILKPRRETIVKAITKQNWIGIVRAEETAPGIYLGNCLVEPKDYTCPLDGEPLTCTATVEHEINTRADTSLVNTRPYRLPYKHKTEVNKQVQEMLKNGIIRTNASQWNAPLLVVPKKADASGKPKLRVVVDFRKLNDLTIGDSFPLPNITEILDQLGNAKYFTTLDLASGYHQIPMAEQDKQKTAFSTPYGHYEFNRMPFGLKNAPATFQRLMNSILTGMQGLKCLVYLDDIVIYGASLEDHKKRLKEVLQRLRENNLKLQPDKCEFLRKEVIYLGHIISENGISPDPSKLTAIKEFPTPKKVKDIQSFIGLAGYYRKFIEDFSKIAKPLTKLTKKTEKFEWTMEQQNAFEILKERLMTAPVLMYPDFNQEFIVTTDASDYAIGAVLSQEKVDNDRPIAYAKTEFYRGRSRITIQPRKNY
ncbi:uncharacterized protein LOC115242830 [Formica exsecta]|uniref:uncharacterized protein LOC115242830 n=1 Tax=Formica exsecta TaxID=72781 RepID=UPI001143BAD4|nr:uncharacterized protein LOC115242830 [Formica exsecta]